MSFLCLHRQHVLRRTCAAIAHSRVPVAHQGCRSISSHLRSRNSKPLAGISQQTAKRSIQSGSAPVNDPLELADFPEISSNDLMERMPPYLTREQAETHLYPLYRHGWRLRTMKVGHSINYHCLKRKMFFKGPNSARDFVRLFNETEKNLKHHTIFSVNNERQWTVLTIRSLTHRIRGGMNPGITIKDVNLATELEKQYICNNCSPLGPPLPLTRVQQCEWDQILSAHPWEDGIFIGNTFERKAPHSEMKSRTDSSRS